MTMGDDEIEPGIDRRMAALAGQNRAQASPPCLSAWLCYNGAVLLVLEEDSVSTGNEIVVRLRVPPTLRHSLSAFSGAREIEVRVAPGASISDLAAMAGLDVAQGGLLCALNGRITDAKAILQHGDQVRLIHRLAGG